MTSTELIAVKLFGWELYDETPLKAYPDKKWYRKIDKREDWYEEHYVGYIPNSTNNGDAWPDLNDWNWIKRMEDELLQKELLEEYVNALWKIAPNEYPWCENYQILSTAEQRVAACVKVLEGVQ